MTLLLRLLMMEEKLNLVLELKLVPYECRNLISHGYSDQVVVAGYEFLSLREPQ